MITADLHSLEDSFYGSIAELKIFSTKDNMEQARIWFCLSLLEILPRSVFLESNDDTVSQSVALFSTVGGVNGLT